MWQITVTKTTLISSFAVKQYSPSRIYLQVNPKKCSVHLQILIQGWGKSHVVKPWRTPTSSRPLHQASTRNPQSPDLGSPRWTCCCCCCCVQPCGWAATDTALAGPVWPSCADAFAASTAADAPPYSALHGFQSDAGDRLENESQLSNISRQELVCLFTGKLNYKMSKCTWM